MLNLFIVLFFLIGCFVVCSMFHVNILFTGLIMAGMGILAYSKL